MGNEFDDVRQQPVFRGIILYFGVYDQHQDFDIRMKQWYKQRIPEMRQWSAVRSISGLIVENILVRRYPHLAQVQRSCHSCHFENGAIIPCGRCSKCLGVLLFLLANKLDPKIMKYTEKDIKSFHTLVGTSGLRLDQDEKNQSLCLLYGGEPNKNTHHVEKIHVNDTTCDLTLIPAQFRNSLIAIIEHFTTGYCRLDRGKWRSIEKVTYKES